MDLKFPVVLQGQMAIFLLVLLRVGGLFAVTPFFAGPAVPSRLKALFAAGIALCVAPVLAPQSESALLALSTPGSALATIASELALGVAIGFFMAVVIGAIQTAGHFIAQEMGMTVARTIDPLTSIQSTILAQMLSSFAILMFILLDFHHHLIRLITQSFHTLPIGYLGRGMAGNWGETFQSVAREQGRALFQNAVHLAMPFTITLLLVTVAMGFLARAVPEMNVFVLGLILRILIGMGILVILFPVVADVFENLFRDALDHGAVFIRSLNGAH